MEWEEEAEQLLSRAPVFVRPLVRRKVEEFARARGATRITGTLAQQAYAAVRGKADDRAAKPSAELLGQLEAEAEAFARGPQFRTRHFTIQPCASAVGCPRAPIPVKELAEALAAEIADSGLPGWLEAGLGGRPLLSHHRFQIAVAGCPNACSQPQIRDFGVIGAAMPELDAARCTACLRCVQACHEGALTVEEGTPHLDATRCLGCGDCVRVCESGALISGVPSYRILIGGKLGRHPRLAEEVARVGNVEEVVAWLRRVLDVLMRKGKSGERVGAVLEREGSGVFSAW